MARKKIIAGNWKMNMTPSQAVELINTLKPLVATEDADVVFCVPAIDIIPAIEAAKGSNIEIGAENMYYEEKGAYTGEIAPDMLTDVGVKYVIIGHSERREYFAETNETVNKKVLKAFEHGITPIVCCGESLTQREQGITIDWIRQQIKIAFLGVTAEQAKTAVIAYEPIWAIGTGKTATTEQAQEVCAAIRVCIGEIYDEATAEAIRIQYGGSVNAGTAAELFAQPDIDGGLVGIGVESTIIDVTEETPTILRPGHITKNMIAKVIGTVQMDAGLSGLDQSVKPKAPGMKYRHYAPKASMTVIQGKKEAVIRRIEELAAEYPKEKVGILAADETLSCYTHGQVVSAGSRNEHTIEQGLYRALREFDHMGVSVIFSESFADDDRSEAIMNRLLKAAGQKIEYLSDK